jgi:hypothetical protein
MDTLTNRITPATYRDPKRQRLYLKDIDTPDAWANHLKEIMPESVYYLNECIEPRTGGDGAIREPNEYGQMVYGKGVAPAGDLMSSLPPEMRALNMMCYIGHEGTYTPCHREMCASLGHNIMVEASEDRKGERAGSSIWFMTETKEREVVSEYFLSMLGHDIEVEKHFAQVNAWKKAPFNVWIVEQKVGDLILIPPLAPHQVWNRGTRTMKAAWNRTTVDTLELALHEALPRARMVCREEQYKNKAIVYYSLVKYHGLLQRDTVEPKMWKYGRIKQVLEDFKRLFALYTEILVSEMFSPKLPAEADVEFLEFDSNVTCSYCRGNIFNRFLTCKSCIQVGPNGEEDTYDICMDCYAMGRSCACISNLSWVEQWNWSTLVQRYEQWRGMVVQYDGFFDGMRSPQPLGVARKRYGKKPVAEVCQEQLKLRPWNDITKPTVRDLSQGMSDDEPEVDDEGHLKKKGKKLGRSSRGKLLPIKDKTYACHICRHHDWNWKLAFCTTCNLAYCYGVLWRAFDLMPQSVMEDKEWSCPRCLKICSCGRCRKTSTQKPYAPKGTLLGHDTRRVADYRSVESLVDFSKTNLPWLRGENESNPHESSRMKKLKEKAKVEKARVDTIDESYFDGVEPTSFAADNGGKSAQTVFNQEIDPLLLGVGESSTSNAQHNGYYQGPYASIESTINGDCHAPANGLDENLAANWIDNNGHYEFDEYNQRNSYNPQLQSFPTRTVPPLAPILAPEQSYPDLSHVGQNRMMGAGFYQQGNGVDRILFNVPDEQGSDDEVREQTLSQNPNLAFSDLLDPPLQVEEIKKRKGFGYDGAEDEEYEFFTSKRLKKMAKSEKSEYEFGGNGEVTDKARPGQRPPRRIAGKAQSYEDLGEDGVQIEDDEGLSAASTYRKHNSENLNSDIDLAAQALSRLDKPQTQEMMGKKRGRPKKREMHHMLSQSASPALNTIKPRRKWASLARKEAKEPDSEFPPELPKRTRRARCSLGNGQANPSTGPIDISSGSEDRDDRGARIEEINSLFDEPIERDNSTGREDSPEEGVMWTASEGNSSIQLAGPKSSSEVEIQAVQKPRKETVDDEFKVKKPESKHRRRPRRKPLSVDLKSPLPVEEVRPTPVKKLLSLKEKLALKGKRFKIVAAKPRQAFSGSPSGPPSASNSPTIPLKSILQIPSSVNPVGWTGINDNGNIAKSTPGVSSATQFVMLASGHNNPVTASTPAAVQPPARPVHKGPTVIRLLSPSAEPEEGSVKSAQSGQSSWDLVSDDNDSDSSRPHH